MKFTDYWDVLQRRNGTTSSGKSFITSNEWFQNAKLVQFLVVRVVKYVNAIMQKYNTADFDWASPLQLFKKQLKQLFISTTIIQETTIIHKKNQKR